MGDITDQHEHTSPTDVGDSHSVGNGNSAGNESRGVKRQRPSADDDDDDDEKGGRERRKIEIKFISDKSRRHITFSKRKAGIMKKAYELSVLTGTQVLLLVVSETGLVYTFTTPKLQPLVTKAEGKNLIQACLNAPEPTPGNENGVDDTNQVDSPEEPAGQHLPPQQRPNMAPQTHMPPATCQMLETSEMSASTLIWLTKTTSEAAVAAHPLWHATTAGHAPTHRPSIVINSPFPRPLTLFADTLH
ncbi:unnamed protein product [Parascedosporium putredinis]|uniref:MADS-box domain-containing protein n=1 Tax=Parascedosporium putredinis TaxID=1442378 RepID=A0A9P1GVN6_9PEZI|nr:unnamed protein product [Parascedosporium putredinis]CAI7988200.1 unnamed protein product [Parascedosporium putredinis]